MTLLLLSGGLLVLALCFVALLTAPRATIDLDRGEFYSRHWPLNLARWRRRISLADVAGLQICGTYELNLVLREPAGERITLVDACGREKIDRLAQRLGALLSVPVWDHVQLSRPVVPATCPKYFRQVPARNVSLDTGWTKCEDCNEIVAGYPAQQKPQVGRERPADALTRVNRTPGRLAIEQPAQGLGTASCGKYLSWAIISLISTAGTTPMILGLAAPDPPGQPNWDLSVILFLVGVYFLPCCLFACYMLGAVVWLSSVKRSICCDAHRMDMELRCWCWRRRYSVSRGEVEGARPRTMLGNEKENLGNMDCTHAVQIVYGGGLFNLPCKHAAEQAWLVDEISEFLSP